MNTEWARQRRNVITISIALTIFWGAGGQFDESIVIGEGVRLENPLTLVVIAIFVWLYLLWRYWLYSKEYHPDVVKTISTRFSSMECYKKLIECHVCEFRDKSGVSFDEAFQKAAIEAGSETNFMPMSTSFSVKRGLRKHTLTIYIYDSEGEYACDEHQVEISALEYEKCHFCAFFQSFMADRIVSDIVVPYCVSMLPPVAWILSKVFV